MNNPKQYLILTIGPSNRCTLCDSKYSPTTTTQVTGVRCQGHWEFVNSDMLVSVVLGDDEDQE